MHSRKPLCFPLLCLPLVFLLLSGLQCEARLQRYGTKKLFVFGDSYVDAGNIQKGLGSSWRVPYGETFPGKPAGRFSDGRVFSDYIAIYLGLKSPIPYRLRKLMPQQLKYGMNFAYGGTGVFDTSFQFPNMTIQIDFFQELIKERVYSSSDLSNSVALVSVAGNDYTYYLQKNVTGQGFPSFIASLVNQTVTNLIRLKSLGVKKIVVNGLQPLGCLPQTTAPSFQQCNATTTDLVFLHNKLLNEAVTKLNQQAKDHSKFIVLDLYDSFMSVLNNPSKNHIKDHLKPCCVGISSEYSCGSVDRNVKKYTVCENPKSAFFWDSVHLTQAGWNAVYNKLQTTRALHQLLY